MDLAERNEVSTDEPGGAARELAVLTLDENGTIRDCSLTGESLFGYLQGELVRQHVSSLFPQLSEVALVKNSEINPRLGFLCHCGHRFQSRGRGGGVFMSKLSLIHLGYGKDRQVLRLIVRDAAQERPEPWL